MIETVMKKLFYIPLLSLLACSSAAATDNGRSEGAVGLVYRVDAGRTYQTMHSFGASDAWRAQYVGMNWPEEKKNQVADWLFSMETDEAGNPRGIGLSMWRFNIGSGSYEQGEASGITNTWTRVECFLSPDGSYDFTKQAGQQWFLEAARERGVENFLAFTIAPPWFMSLNGKTVSQGKEGMNIRPDQYDDYARFLVTVMKHFADEKNIRFGYVSPVNEPQWDWNTPRQEGTYANNEDCYKLIRELNDEISRQGLDTKIVFGEAGAIKYLYGIDPNVPDTDNQICEFFSDKGAYPILGMENVLPCVSGHSYWSTWPVDNMIDERRQLKECIDRMSPGLGYWQTEYCVMENNAETKGGGAGRDLGMDIALYVARIIHYDITVAQAASWQWWTALSPYDYKDGLIYLDDGTSNGIGSGNAGLDASLKQDGVARTSKLMWALGNFSRFVRPGMTRVDIASATGVIDPNLLLSAYEGDGQNVVVIINLGTQERTIGLESKAEEYRIYETSETADLACRGNADKKGIRIPARSVITLVAGPDR